MSDFPRSSVEVDSRTPAAIRRLPRWRVLSEPILSTITIFFVSILSHAIFIPWLGYYWDDWIILWDGLALGHEGMVFQMSWDRAFFAVWHGAIFGFIGDNTLLWHVYFFVLLTGGGLLLVWALRGLWPKQRFATTAVGLLYVVYPGFLGQPYAHLYHIHFFALAMGILSLGATIRAVQAQNQRTALIYIAMGMVSSAAYLFIYEIYVSFEVVRILLIGVLIWRQKSRFTLAFFNKLAKYYLPYLVVVLVFVFWRVFIFKSIRSQTDLGYLVSLYHVDPIKELLRIPVEWVRSFLNATVFAWFVPAQARASEALGQTLLISVGVGLAAAAGVVLYERRTRQFNENDEKNGKLPSMRWAWQLTLVGLIATLIGLLPPILSNINLKLLELTDRFSLTAVVPIAMLVIGLIFLFTTPKTRPWIIGVLVGLSVMTQFNNGNHYRNVWRGEMDLWWQMYWRVPALQEGTLLLTSVPTNSFFPVEPQEIWAPANLIYAPDANEQPLIFGLRLTDAVAEEMVTRQNYEYVVEASLHFAVNFDNSLIVYAPDATSCLRVVDETRPLELPENASGTLRWTAPHSNINQIIPDAPSPKMRSSIFGSEPKHTWCYYFQKAELARQLGNWEAVTLLGDTAQTLGYSPQDASEWLPFIQGYVAVGRCEDAQALSAVVLEAQPYIQAEVLPQICEA